MRSQAAVEWTALLTGKHRAAGLRVVRELTTLVSRTRGESAWRNAEDALFFYYVSKQWPDEGFGEESRESVARVFEAIERFPANADLLGGIPGVGWVLAHIQGADDEALDALDEWILGAAEVHVSRRAFDLASGLAGLAVYACERWPRGAAEQILNRVVEGLAKLAVRSEGQTRWHTPTWLLSPQVAALHPAGHFDVGLAHGAGGVVLTLSAAARLLEGRSKALATGLLDGAFQWLRRCRIPGSPNVFPRWIVEGVSAAPSRAAWCYGAPGVAMALSAVGSDEADELAAEVVRRLSEITVESSGVVDATVCHGSAGVAHLLNRLHRRVGVPAAGEAAIRWLTYVLEQREAGVGLGGYSHVGRNSGGQTVHQADAGLMTGIAGIGLVLLAGCSNHEPAWDRLILP